MTYTEIKLRNRKKYYYRVLSMRNGQKVTKKRIYLGSDMTSHLLSVKEQEADETLRKEKREKRKAILKKLIAKIRKVLKKYHIRKASLFGSYARGDQKKNSDIDLIIEPTSKMSLFDLTGISLEMEEEMGKKVDLLTYNSIHHRIKKYVEKDEVRIL